MELYRYEPYATSWRGQGEKKLNFSLHFLNVLKRFRIHSVIVRSALCHKHGIHTYVWETDTEYWYYIYWWWRGQECKVLASKVTRHGVWYILEEWLGPDLTQYQQVSNRTDTATTVSWRVCSERWKHVSSIYCTLQRTERDRSEAERKEGVKHNQKILSFLLLSFEMFCSSFRDILQESV